MNTAVYNMPEGGPAADVAGRLLSLKRRGKALVFLGGTAWTAVALILTAAGFMAALGWWGGGELRAAGWISMLAVTLVVGTWKIVLPVKRLSGADSVARRIGAARPGIASGILSASQFVSGGPIDGFSRDLLSRHLAESSAKLDSVPVREVFPARMAAVPVVVLAAVLGGLFLFEDMVPGVMRMGAGSIFSDPHVPPSAVVETVTRSPVVGDLTMILRYPEYLGRKARKLSDSTGSIVAPMGTTVTLEGRALLERVGEGGIRLPGGKVTPMNVRRNGRVSGRFLVETEGTFSLIVGNDRKMVEGPGHGIEIEEDSAPTVRLLRPVNDVVVDESGEVALEFEAMDDHGITRVDLVLDTGEGGTIRRTILRTADRVERIKSGYRWLPSSTKLGEDAAVDMTLEVFDNDLISGPKPGRSRKIGARIMTRQSRHRSVLEKQQEALDVLIDLLAARLASPVPGGKRREDDARERFTLLRSRTEDVLGRTARLINEMGRDPLTPRMVEEAFLQIREDLSAQLIHEARLHREQMAPFRKRQGVDRVTVRIIEGAVIRVDDLILDQQFHRLVGDGDRLMGDRERIFDLLKGYSRTGNEKARRDLLDAIGAMEKAISRLTRDLEGVRGKVGDVYMNPSAVQVVDLAGALDRLRAMIAADDMAGALALATDLEEMVTRLMTGLESGHLSFRTDRFGEGEKFIGELLDRLMEVESDQLQLRRQTTALRRRYHEKLLGVMKGKIDPLVKKQMVRVGKVRQDLDSATAPGDGDLRGRLVAVKVGFRELSLALGQGDLDEAMEVAGDLGEGIDALRSDPGDRELGAALKRARGVIDQIEREVAEAFPRPAQVMSDRDKRDVRNQAARQRHLTAQTRRLRAWIKKQGDETRFLAHQALGSLNHVASLMSEGVTRLENRKLREALESQTEALDELERLRQDLRRGGEAAQLESRPVVVSSDVEIPDPGEYEVPSEYREDILEAMRGALPSNYREAIERYYETLVR